MIAALKGLVSQIPPVPREMSTERRRGTGAEHDVPFDPFESGTKGLFKAVGIVRKTPWILMDVVLNDWPAQIDRHVAASGQFDEELPVLRV